MYGFCAYDGNLYLVWRWRMDDRRDSQENLRDRSETGA